VPRIIVTTDPRDRPQEASVLLDELVQSVHLSTGHAAAQLVERLAWAISDAEAAEDTKSDRASSARRRTHAPEPAVKYRGGEALAA
jgi:hypothetical protein